MMLDCSSSFCANRDGRPLREFAALASVRVRVRGDTGPTFDETENAASMNKMTKTTGLRVKLVSSFDSRFETLEAAGRPEKSLHAQLGGKLRKVFSPPSPDSTPDSVMRLLRELEDKLE